MGGKKANKNLKIVESVTNGREEKVVTNTHSFSLMLCLGDYVKRMEADGAPELMTEQPDGASGAWRGWKNGEIKAHKHNPFQ